MCDTQRLLQRIYRQGAMIATVRGERWYALFPDGDGKFWLCEGDAERELARSSTCGCANFEQALETFHRWWDRDFGVAPVCGNTKLRLVANSDG